MFDIAAVPFRDVPPEEMKTYEADIKGTGEYIGYKPQQYWVCSIPRPVLHWLNLNTIHSTLRMESETA